MSIFDDHASPKAIDENYQKLEYEKTIQENIVYCLSPGATIIETSAPQEWIEELCLVIGGGAILCDGILAERLYQEQGRQIIRWDAKSFRKYDACGSMFTLSRLPKGNKPIVIIEDITEIPDGDHSIYDDPVWTKSQSMCSVVNAL